MQDDYITNGYMENYKKRQEYYEKLPWHRDFRDYRVVLAEVVGEGRILDYGCGEGSLGLLGQLHGENGCHLPIKVDGLDIAQDNKLAIYHTPEEVQGTYDTILFSHAIEHFGDTGSEQRREVLEKIEWAKKHTRRIIAAGPNTRNPFMMLAFYDDWTHNKPYDNNDFLYLVEKTGWKLKTPLIRCDARLSPPPNGRSFKRRLRDYQVCYARFITCVWLGKDTTYNVIYEFEPGGQL